MQLTLAIRAIRERLVDSLDGFIRGEKDFAKAKAIVPFFYYFLFFTAFTRLEGFENIIMKGSEGFTPRFPLFWTENLEFATIVTAIFLLNAATSLLASFFPYSRLARIAAFAGLFAFHAYSSSFGSPFHQWDHFLWVAFILMFLPARHETAEARKKFSLVFWTAQAYLLLTYTMAGTGKLIYAAVQFSEGQAHAFSPDAGALFAATQLNQMGISMPLSPLLIEHPYLAWLPFLIMLEIQTFAIVAAFRPELHRLWGLGLVFFHVGTLLTMRAVFVAPSALLMIFLLASPFAPEKLDIRATVHAIPLVGPILRLIERAFARKA